MSTRQKLVLVAALYFAEGFPFGMFMDIIPVYLRLQNVSLTGIGLVSAAGFAWSLKFFWAPAVDRWGARSTWIWACQALLVIPLLGFAQENFAGVSWTLWTFIILLVLLSATQDIAIDAYTIQLLDKREMGLANGVRVTAYRFALYGTNLLLAAAEFVGWPPVFLGAAALLAGFSLLSFRAPAAGTVPSRGSEESPRTLSDAIVMPFRQFLLRPGFLAVAAFVLTFKLGDMALGPMVAPFWVDRKFSAFEIGMVKGTLGGLATIGGALLGGALTSRWGIFRALWVLGIFQAVSNLVYAAAAALPPNTALMYGASLVESFCGGLGTAPFLAFLMSICSKAHAATQYALLSALFGLTRALSGAFSGVATEGMGYAAYFTATFFLAWPAFLLLPWVKDWAGEEHEKGEGP